MAKHLASKRHKHLSGAENITRQSGRRRVWRKVVGLLAGTVVFCTTYALILPAITMESAAEVPHVHDQYCYSAVLEEGEKILSCEALEEDGIHTHTDDCYETTVVQKDAGKLLCSEDHTHTTLCFGQWELNCPLLWTAASVMVDIEALPSADEIAKKVSEYEAAGDSKGELEYYTQVSQAVSAAYYRYSQMSAWQQKQVVNTDKLLELDFIWSKMPLTSGITSDAPTQVKSESTADFIELNLYDYVYGINTNWNANKQFPGFQWNGGAYSGKNYTYENADVGILNTITDRYAADSIDFGNSIIKNYVYGGTGYGKSTTATKVIGGTGLINSWNGGNLPIGMSKNDFGDAATTTNDVIARTLTSDGYPALAPASGGGSLAYLFGGTTGVSYVQKQNSSSIDGLFQVNPTTGAYYYNSRLNHAEYDYNDYDGDGITNEFILFNEILTPNFILYPFGNFLPMNSITSGNTATQVGSFNENGGMKKYVDQIIADLDAALNRDDDGNGTTADYGDTSRKQLKVMLLEYQENWNWFPTTKENGTITWSGLSPANAIRDYFLGSTSGGGDKPSSDVSFVTQAHLDQLYNIDWDEATNFFFGMEIKMNLMQPKDGLTGKDNGNNTSGTWQLVQDGTKEGSYQLTGSPDGKADYPMSFNFTGDDDVWVYIDGMLFLDLSGIHRHVGGRIDFQAGKVHYYELDTAGKGDVSSTPSQTFSFADLIRAAWKYKDSSMTDAALTAKVKEYINPATGTFYDYSTHAFKFFYLERGSGSSVCRMNFNFPVLKDNPITVTKELDPTVDMELLGNPDYYFNIIKRDESGLFIAPGTEYRILDSVGNQAGTGKVDKYGIFTIKAGQTAVFEGIAENAGEFYVQELIKDADHDLYRGKVTVNGGSVPSSGTVNWYKRSWYSEESSDAEGEVDFTGPYDSIWHFYSSQYGDASNINTLHFEMQNGLNSDKLTTLEISKKVSDYADSAQPDKVFKFKITLDGEPLPENAASFVENGTISFDRDSITNAITASYIRVKAGATAKLKNLISGTQFTLQEVEHSGYTVAYQCERLDWLSEDSGILSGIVRVNAAANVTATNTENKASVTIPGSKDLLQSDGTDHTFSFDVAQVTDSTGATVVNEGHNEYYPFSVTGNSVTVNPADATVFSISIGYTTVDKAALPKTFYYKITERDTDDALPNSAAYVARVTLSVNAQSGAVQAVLDKLYLLGGDTPTEVPDKAATFTNILTGDLTLGKVVSGGAEAKKHGFTFKVKLTLPEGVNPPVEIKYRFRIRSEDAQGNVSYTWQDTWTTAKLETQETTLKYTSVMDGEAVQFSKLPIGTTWSVTEEDYDGFLPSGTVTVNNVTSDVIQGNTLAGTVTSDDTLATVINTATYVLPETGGMGTGAFAAVGFGLMLFSAAWLLYKRKRRREEALSP